ncbi:MULTISPECIES: hypothetical protein [unclassified Bradyrhizobium]
MIVMSMRCEQSFTSRALPQESDADAPVAPPNGTAIPHEFVACDGERERVWQRDRRIEVDRRAAVRHVSYGARDTAIFKADRATFEDPVTLCCAFLNHLRSSVVTIVN